MWYYVLLLYFFFTRRRKTIFAAHFMWCKHQYEQEDKTSTTTDEVKKVQKRDISMSRIIFIYIFLKSLLQRFLSYIKDSRISSDIYNYI